jgi:hypothetical protein
MRGLDPRIHLFRKEHWREMADRRVEPGDGG